MAITLPKVYHRTQNIIVSSYRTVPRLDPRTSSVKMIWPDGHACIKGPWLGWRQSVGEPWFPMGPSKILGGCDVRSQEFVPVQSCHINCQLAMSQSESAYSAIADWHWTTSNTTEVAIRAPYGDMGTSQRRNGDVRTWWHVGKIGPWSYFIKFERFKRLRVTSHILLQGL